MPSRDRDITQIYWQKFGSTVLMPELRLSTGRRIIGYKWGWGQPEGWHDSENGFSPQWSNVLTLDEARRVVSERLICNRVIVESCPEALVFWGPSPHHDAKIIRVAMIRLPEGFFKHFDVEEPAWFTPTTINRWDRLDLDF